MNNPIFNMLGASSSPQMSSAMQLIAAMQAGKNPIAALAAMNPQLAQQLQGKTPQELEQYVRSEYAKRGVDLDTAMRNINSLLQFKNF